MELNSLEARKQFIWSWRLFLPVVSIERELAGGSILDITDLEVKKLKLITNPSRYTSRAWKLLKIYTTSICKF